MTAEISDNSSRSQIDYSLFDIVECINGCVIQFSDKFRNLLGEEWEEFHSLYGNICVKDHSYLELHPEIQIRADEITEQHFGITVEDIENTRSVIRQAYLEARRGGGDTQKEIDKIVAKLGCDFLPYVPIVRKPVTKPYIERVIDLLNIIRKEN